MQFIIKNYFVLLTLFCFCQPDSMEKPNLIAETDLKPSELENWRANVPQNWESIDTDAQTLYRLTPDAEPEYSIRRPQHTAVWTLYSVDNFKLVVKAKSRADSLNPKRDICLFFGYQDSLHYYYAHFSATSDKVHNIIGLVNNADRKKINLEPAGESTYRLDVTNWHTLSVVRNSDSGWIKAYIDDLETPVMTAKDTTFKKGFIGIGSFDDPVDFDRVKLYTFE